MTHKKRNGTRPPDPNAIAMHTQPPPQPHLAGRRLPLLVRLQQRLPARQRDRQLPVPQRAHALGGLGFGGGRGCLETTLLECPVGVLWLMGLHKELFCLS